MITMRHEHGETCCVVRNSDEGNDDQDREEQKRQDSFRHGDYMRSKTQEDDQQPDLQRDGWGRVPLGKGDSRQAWRSVCMRV